MYLKTVRPRIAQQRTAALLVLDIEKLRADLARILLRSKRWKTWWWTAVSERLAGIDRSFDEITQADAAAVLTEVDSRLSYVRRWVNARRRAALLADVPDDARNALLQSRRRIAASQGD